jgi:hypothetical protein
MGQVEGQEAAAAAASRRRLLCMKGGAGAALEAVGEILWGLVPAAVAVAAVAAAAARRFSPGLQRPGQHGVKGMKLGVKGMKGGWRNRQCLQERVQATAQHTEVALGVEL